MEDINQLKKRVNLLEYIKEQYSLGKETKSNGGLLYKNCPICKSTSTKAGDNGHFFINPNTNSYSSFSSACSCKGGSIIDFMIEAEHLTQQEAIQKLYKITGEEQQSNYSTNQNRNIIQTTEIKTDNEETEKTKAFILQEIQKKNIDSVVQELSKRGISKEIAEKYNIFISNQTGKQRLYIPIIENNTPIAYVSRAIEETDSQRYKNSKGEIVPFNRIYITEKPKEKEVIYLCEGIFDALSIEEMQKKAIALNSTSNTNKFIEYMKEHIQTASKYHYILCFDNDTAGEKATKEMKEALQELKINHQVLDIPKDYKDINEWYIAVDKQYFKEQINTYNKQSIFEYINTSFLNDIEKLETYKGRTTGFKELDKAINGVIPGLYVLGAISSLGKTTFISQLGDQLASSGEKIIFFSLEQSKFELTAKSISRQTFIINPRQAKTSLSIMQSTDIADITLEAVREYQETANNTIRVEGNFDMNVNTIRNYIENYIAVTGIKPIVILDYLQILRPINEKLTDKQQVDFNISELKRISRDNDIPIFVICSFNRDNYIKQVDFTSFKESGAIEYGADVVMGLQLKAIKQIEDEKSINKQRNIINNAKDQDIREVELIGLKNRNGKSYFKCSYKYYAPFNYFEEIEKVEGNI